MKLWRRIHESGLIKTLVIKQEETGMYGIVVHEPHGQRRISKRHVCADVETAKLTADDLVNTHYPHTCTAGKCSQWETPNSSRSVI